MFDWNDEELANIIWGDTGESGDHIVPYPDEIEEKPPDLCGDHIKKELNQESADFKPAEQKKHVAKTDLPAGKLELSLQDDTTGGLPVTGFGMDSLPDLSLSHVTKTYQDSTGTDGSNETARLENGPEIFENQHEDKKQDDIVEYGWDNIGNFDDLNRIFSDDVPIVGHTNLGHAEELWLSSKDVTRIPEKLVPLSINSPDLELGALRSTSENFELKTECMLDKDQSFLPDNEKINETTSHASQNLEARMDRLGYAGGKNKLLPKEKVNRQKRSLKSRKRTEEKSDLCGIWSPSGNQFQLFDGRHAPSIGQPYPSAVLSQQKQLQELDCALYNHFSNPLLAPSMYGNISNQSPAMPLFPQLHPECNYQPVLPGYEVSPGNSNPLKRPEDTPVKALTMTPQEKIEKLRRRQQMQAMLAIQNQQQQFTHQASCTEQSVAQTFPCESPMQLMEVGNIKVEENMSILPSLGPNSPIEQEDSSTVYMAIDASLLEDTILYQLQEIIAKLDIRIRLCIRDSLFRLAQSAVQRQYASDASSTNKSSRDELKVLAKEEFNSHRFARMPDEETQTNPIDRTVAYLLFHRPLELSGKFPDALESPVSAKHPPEKKTTGLMSLSMGILPESSQTRQALSHQGSKIPCSFAKASQSRNSPCMDTFENASNNEAGENGAMEVKAF